MNIFSSNNKMRKPSVKKRKFSMKSMERKESNESMVGHNDDTGEAR